jgi:tRNA U55 pseudouridine synthase TruB
MPTKDVEIYSIEKLGETEMRGGEIAENVLEKIALVSGDFRQGEIGEEWYAFGEEFGSVPFKIITLRVKCSSGTYMRSLAERIGRDEGSGALAYSIKRLEVGKYVI